MMSLLRASEIEICLIDWIVKRESCVTACVSVRKVLIVLYARRVAIVIVYIKRIITKRYNRDF